MSCLPRVATAAAAIAVLTLAPGPPRAAGAEVAAQACFALIGDDQTKGGGAGLALEAGMPVLRNVVRPDSSLALKVRASVLIGAGLAWSGELGAAFRARVAGRWAPELGVWLLYVGGDLVRAIDERGHLAGNPLAAQLALNPLRFELGEAWVSFLSMRWGTTLFRSGHPAFALSATLLEIGRRW